MKFYFCKECGTKRTYLTKEALLADHPTLKNYPELIGEIERTIKRCKWRCPKCNSQCGGVAGHPGPHQCPTHYRRK